jgi:hypothetical protein
MLRSTSLGFTVLLLACGLERDWERWQQAALSATEVSESSTSTSAGDTSTADQSSGASVGDTTAGDTSTGPADVTTLGSSSTSEPDTSTTTGVASACGDGVVGPGEECDDPADLHCFNCYKDRRVFVTSQSFQGDWFNTSNNFYYWCNHLAGVADLLDDPAVPQFVAWVSTSEGSAADRLFHSPGRYILVNDQVFAESWDDLIAGNILNPLEVDENSQTRVVPVWTGTRPEGTAILPENGNQCENWTDDSFGNWAHYGYSDEIDGQWTLYTDPQPCLSDSHLYCFESP